MCLTCLRLLRAHMLTCLRVLRAYVLTCQRSLRAYVLTCLVCLRVHMPTCLACLSAHIPPCFACSRANVLTYLAYLHAHVPTYLACLLQIKISFLWHVLLRILILFLCLFPVKKNNKTVYEKSTASRNISRNIYFENSVVHSCISLTRQKPLTGAMTNFVQ